MTPMYWKPFNQLCFLYIIYTAHPDHHPLFTQMQWQKPFVIFLDQTVTRVWATWEASALFPAFLFLQSGCASYTLSTSTASEADKNIKH